MSKQDFSPIVTLPNKETDQESSALPRSLDPELQGGETIPTVRDSFAALEPENFPLTELTDITPTDYWREPSAPEEAAVDIDVDIYADRLMDEIFTEVEHTLDSGVAPLEVEEVEVLNIRSLSMPSLALPAALVPRVDAYSPEIAALPAGKISDPVSPFVDRLLLGSVLVSCAITLGWWALDRDRYDVLLSSPAALPSESSAATVQPETPNEQFVAYLQNSLQTLEQTSTSAGQGEAAATANNPLSASSASTVASLPSVPTSLSADLPTVAVPGTPSIGDLSPLPSTTQNAPQAAAQGTVLERVYIPVYPNTPGLVAPQSAVAGSLPGVLNPAPPLLASGKLPTVPVGVSGAPVATTAGPANPTTAEQPAPGVAPLPEPATVSHSLVGILELGDQSAALFQVNGVTRRVHLGEAIGSAGWMLVDVSNQEAIIRRNGEVRSVYIGQNF
ncbi:MAG: hypothetical protein ACO3EZ_11885 [Prochlorotrichaceae cyanobacterium]